MSSSSSPSDKGNGFNSNKSSPFDVFLKKKDDCDRPACEDTVSALSSALNRLNEKKKKGGKGAMKNTTCPPTKDYIGKSSWTLLHSMAAWYPDKPTLDEEQKMTQFMDALSIFYPCTHCADDFQINLKVSPVRTKTRKDLCTWLCEQHNSVNEKLGKPIFDCSMKNLDKRWRKNSDPECESQ